MRITMVALPPLISTGHPPCVPQPSLPRTPKGEKGAKGPGPGGIEAAGCARGVARRTAQEGTDLLACLQEATERPGAGDMHVGAHDLVGVGCRGRHHFTESADAHLTAPDQTHKHALALAISSSMQRKNLSLRKQRWSPSTIKVEPVQRRQETDAKALTQLIL